MAEIVLIHGIAQQQKNAVVLEEEWLKPLAGAIQLAGFGALADRLWRNRSLPDGIDACMAFYGHLFLKSGGQGDEPPELTGKAALLAEQLAWAWLENAADRASPDNAREIAKRELDYVFGGQEGAQGLRTGVCSLIGSLARIPWFAPYGFAFAEKFVDHALAQVTLYMTDETIRERTFKAVFDLVDPKTRVLIGHSLGSVIAFEAAHKLSQPLALLMTLGSPLALRTIIYERLHPQPPSYPSQVQRWVNVAARDDLIAAEPDLTMLFSAGKPEGAILQGIYTVDNGAEPHNACFYLAKAEVGRPVAEALMGM